MEAKGLRLSKKVQKEKLLRIREIERDLYNLFFNHSVKEDLPDESCDHVNDFFSENANILSKHIHRLIEEWRSLKGEILLSNIGIIVKAVSRWSIPSTSTYDDLLQEGIIAGMKSVDRFNPKLGYAITTYMSKCVFYSMYRIFYAHSKIVKEPAYLRVVRCADNKQTRKNGGKQIDEKHLSEISGFRKTAIKIARNEVRVISIEAFNKSAGSDRNSGVSLIIQRALTYEGESQEEAVSNSQLKKFAMDSLKVLNRREKVVMIKRYGLLDYKPLTLREIGKDLGVSRERVRQIENDALFKLRRKLKQQDVFEVIR
jgi:RNA polymerase primary sigma factor